MDAKLQKLCDEMTFEQFETALLLYINYHNSVVVSSSSVDTIKLYSCWDDIDELSELVAICKDGTDITEKDLKERFPGYDDYIVFYPSIEEKIEMIGWLYMPNLNSYPPNIKELAAEVKLLENLFDDQSVEYRVDGWLEKIGAI